MLQQVIQVLYPHDLERRQSDEEDIADELNDSAGTLAAAGFKPGDDVAASQELRIKDKIIAHLGSKAVVVAGDLVHGRITVKFDERLDGSTTVAHVLPSEIVPQLPATSGVAVGDRIVAAKDLYAGSICIVRHGTHGVIERQSRDEIRMIVQFTERNDGTNNKVSLMPHEITPYCMLAGGFWPLQRVQAARDLYAADKKLIRAGMSGIICARFSETRFSVKFDEREDNCEALVNVVPQEVIPIPIEDSSKLFQVHAADSEASVSSSPTCGTQSVLLFGCSIALSAVLLARVRQHI